MTFKFLLLMDALTHPTPRLLPCKIDEGDIEMVASTDPNMPVLDLNSAVVESIELALQSREGGSHAGGCDI